MESKQIIKMFEMVDELTIGQYTKLRKIFPLGITELNNNTYRNAIALIERTIANNKMDNLKK